eukprot:6934483-Prymnesium_polylepis.1
MGSPDSFDPGAPCPLLMQLLPRPSLSASVVVPRVGFVIRRGMAPVSGNRLTEEAPSSINLPSESQDPHDSYSAAAKSEGGGAESDNSVSGGCVGCCPARISVGFSTKP